MRRCSVILGVLVAAAALAATAGAATIHQVSHFPDGSTAVFTLSDEGIPAAGAGDAAGEFGPGAAENSHSGVFTDPAVAARQGGGNGAGSHDGIGPLVTGSQTMYGRVDYTNIYGVTLWTYFHQISWSYSNYIVTSIWGQTAGSLNSCCLWGFQGNTSVTHDPAGSANFTAYAQGRYQACVLWACQSKAPWIWLRGNGNGIQTGFEWGIG